MKIAELYPQALVFEEVPKEVNFIIGQIIVIESQNKAFILDNKKAGQDNWKEINGTNK